MDLLPAFIYDAAFAWAHAANIALEQGILPNEKDMRPFVKATSRNLNNLTFDGKFLVA